MIALRLAPAAAAKDVVEPVLDDRKRSPRIADTIVLGDCCRQFRDHGLELSLPGKNGIEQSLCLFREVRIGRRARGSGAINDSQQLHRFRLPQAKLPVERTDRDRGIAAGRDIWRNLSSARSNGIIWLIGHVSDLSNSTT